MRSGEAEPEARFGDLVRQRRESLGLSLRALADQLGVDHSFLSLIERGERHLSPAKIPAFAGFLGRSESELLAVVLQEKVAAQLPKLGSPTLYLTVAEIEATAEVDRRGFLNQAGRGDLWFPGDRNRIARFFGLEVVEEEALLSPTGKQIFAGLYPTEHATLRGMSGVIGIATRRVKGGWHGEEVSEQTKTFQMLHEIGHYRLHWSQKRGEELGVQRPETPIFCSAGDQSPMEFQANSYAAAFLMPRAELLAATASARSISVAEAKELCERFFVTLETLRKRLAGLQIRIRS